ncbi:MAG: sigma-70 family RNA polymerase sigma factor [Bryobacteraceae bacterium]
MQSPGPHPWTQTDEESLIAAARGGDAEAFEELVRRNYDASLRLATYMLRNRDDAEDEVQTAYGRAFENLDKFREQAKFSTWITRIVMNCCLMRLRKVRRVKISSIDESADGRTLPIALPDLRPDPETAMGDSELLVRLRAELRRIPPLFRDILELRELQELPIPEVAGRLGISVPAAKSRLLRARQELRRRMEKHGSPDMLTA